MSHRLLLFAVLAPLIYLLLSLVAYMPLTWPGVVYGFAGCLIGLFFAAVAIEMWEQSR